MNAASVNMGVQAFLCVLIAIPSGVHPGTVTVTIYLAVWFSALWRVSLLTDFNINSTNLYSYQQCVSSFSL